MVYGKIIPGLVLHGESVDYPVLDDREVRAGAGLMMALGAVAFALAFLSQSYTLLGVVVSLFFVEFAIRVFISPFYAPLYFISGLLVKGQTPDYSGAVQKRFAWSMGLVLSAVMVVVVNVLQLRGIVPLVICIFCLTLMWLESAVGFCAGCKMYNGLIKIGVIHPSKKVACPGGVCSVRPKKK